MIPIYLSGGEIKIIVNKNEERIVLYSRGHRSVLPTITGLFILADASNGSANSITVVMPIGYERQKEKGETISSAVDIFKKCQS